MMQLCVGYGDANGKLRRRHARALKI